MSIQSLNPDAPKVISDFEKELTSLINRYNIEGRSDTPDFILSNYVDNCLTAFHVATLKRDQFYGHDGMAHMNKLDESKQSSNP